MECERWLQLYALACELSRGWPYGQRFSAALIVGVFCWAVLHDRPVSWACQANHWPAELRIGRLPSQSTMSRRLRSQPVQRLLRQMENALSRTSAAPPAAILKLAQCTMEARIIDAKALPVGGCSKDPDARWGRACGGNARGYKFYAVWGRSALPVAWDIQPMNVSEKRVAEGLLARLSGQAWLLGDAQYDSSRLYDLAFAQGHRLLAPRRKKGGLGRHYQSPHRLFAIEQLEGGAWRAFHQARTQIERNFGNWTSFGGGLSPLPSWVRRSHRVRLWIQAKLLINALRIQQKAIAVA